MKEKSIKVNAIYNILLTLSNIVFPLVTFPYVSRILNPIGLGTTSFFTSISSYCVLVASLGISTYGIRAVAKVREDKEELTKVFQELTLINIFMSVIVSILLLFVSFGVEQLRSEMGLLLITCITILVSPLSLNWFYSGIEEYSYITKRSILLKFVSLILTFLLVRKADDYVIYAGITLFSVLSSNALNIIQCRRYVSFKIRKDLKFRHHVKPMWYLFASLLAVNVYTNLDTVMLGFINGNKAVGLYSVATKVKWILLSVVTSISTVLLPRFSFYISQKQTSKFNSIMRESISVIFFISIPLTVFFMLEAKNSILLLGGNEYVEATVAMQMLMPILLISGFSNITGNQILIPTGREKYFMNAVTSGAFVNLMLNFFLMPILGVLGAALATLIAEFTQMFVQYRYSVDYLRGNIPFGSIMKFASSALLSGIFVLGINHLVVINNLIFHLGLSGILYFLFYFLLLVILKEATIKKFLEIL